MDAGRGGSALGDSSTGHVREMSSNGVMDEGSGKVQKAGTHASSLIVVYLAVVELHIAAPEKDSSALSNKEGREMSGQLHPTG